MEKLSDYPTLSTKLYMLTNGLDIDTDRIEEVFPEFYEDFRSIGKRVKIADRAFIEPDSKKRLYIPDELIIKGEDGTSVVKVYYVPDSLYALTVDGSEELVMIEKGPEKRVSDSSILPVKLPEYGKNEFADGSAYSDYISLVGVDRVSMAPYSGCSCWSVGRECLFCGGNPKRLGNRQYDRPHVDDAIESLRSGINYRKWWDSYRNTVMGRMEESMDELIKTDYPSPHFHFLITTGNFPDLDFAWEMTFDLFGALQNVVDLGEIDTIMNLMPPRDLSLIDRMNDEFDIGKVSFNMEVWGDDFRTVCPGKDAFYGYENMVKALEYSKDAVGKGNARCNFVLGAQDVEKTLAGSRWMSERGIVPDYSIFFPRPGSMWSEKAPPSPETVVGFTEELAKMYKTCGYDPIYCRLGSRSSVANEIFELIE